ncbi:MAG TPA: lysophospholipid acyltransferase family protein [Dongiaceae bacterium]|nr:lysophospholipid acyltransferase family protein [Dongiaceae bacterium]
MDTAARFAQPAFSATDLGVLIGAPFFTLPAWLLPERYWPALCRALSPMAIGDLTKDPAASAAAIRRTLGTRLPDLDARRIISGMGAEGIYTFFQVLKAYRPDGWAPPVRIAGFERVNAALERGKGVVLWVAHGFHGHLGAKIGFHRAGLAVVHLSTPAHGFSATRFGVRHLNRIQTRIEDRYIAERVMLPVDNGDVRGQNAALQTLIKRLRANGVVSITGQRGTGRTVAAPFLDGTLTLAPGAPMLAHMTGAALIPVFAFREEDGSVAVTAERPMALDGARDAVVAEAVRAFATVSEPHVLRHPAQWLSWVQL